MITLHWIELAMIIAFVFLISLIVWAAISLFSDIYEGFSDWENGWSDGWEEGYKTAHDRINTILDEFPSDTSKGLYLTSKQYVKYYEDRIAFKENREFSIEENN